jgi:hypothetical protein
LSDQRIGEWSWRTGGNGSSEFLVSYPIRGPSHDVVSFHLPGAPATRRNTVAGEKRHRVLGRSCFVVEQGDNVVEPTGHVGEQRDFVGEPTGDVGEQRRFAGEQNVFVAEQNGFVVVQNAFAGEQNGFVPALFRLPQQQNSFLCSILRRFDRKTGDRGV